MQLGYINDFDNTPYNCNVVGMYEVIHKTG